jgi:hypothetical protein
VDHWFDRLSQPHTRRTMLKAGAVAGVALVLPAGRIPKAWATTGEPCFKPCTDAAAKDFRATRSGTCDPIGGGSLLVGAIGLGSIPGFASQVVNYMNWLNCLGNTELNFHRAVESCRGSECGDPAKYPGGQTPRKPPPKCTAGSEVVCGDICCDIISQCCPCSTVEGGYICCAGNANCDCCPKQ